MSPHADDRRRLFEAYTGPLLDRAAGYAYALLRHRADAEDAVQEALLKGYLHLDDYDPTRPFKGWWFAVLANCCRDLLRRRRRRSEVPLGPADAAGPGPDARREELLDALGRLTPLQREVLELRYFGDCSYREIAAALGIPEGTVMSRLHAARQALAALYAEAHA